ncbi:MAG: PQQ-dependent sugar dehydrogenase, partial [Myxococcota bacterium]
TPGTYRPAPDNPFIDEPLVDSSIYAYGFRNPWKLSVDRGTGVIWAADVGGDEREEVNRVEAGGNYGWPIYEGTVARQSSLTSTLCNGCETLGPVTELCHPTVGAVTGGYVYRGSAFPELAGRYIFADFLTGLLFGIPADTTSFAEAEVLGENAFGLSSFVEDANGELFALGLITGTVQRLGPVAELLEPAPVLTTSGFVDPDNPTQPPSTALPYDVRWTFFSDDAAKRRWVILPEDTSMVELEDGAVEVPVGSVVVKHFELDGRPIETRALRLLEP